MITSNHPNHLRALRPTTASLISQFPVSVALIAIMLVFFGTAPVAAQINTFSLTERARAAEGASAFLTITLSEDAPDGGVAFIVAAGFSGSSSAEAEDVMSIDSPVTVPGGTRTLSIAIPLTDDDFEEDEETFTITIATTAEGWIKQGDGKDTAVVAIDDDDNAGVYYSGVDRGWHIGRIIAHQQTPKAYQVVLTSRPVADVTIEVAATFWNRVSPASHTFSASSVNDWREPKKFTVTGGGRIGAAVITHRVFSDDTNYSTLQGTDWSPPSDKLQLTVRPPLPTRLTLRADRVPAEGGGAVTVTATLDNPAPLRGTTIRLTPSGTATGGGVDYTLSSTTISIAEIQTTGTATIMVTDDRANDDGETIWLDAASTNPPLTAPRLALKIADNDRPLLASVSSTDHPSAAPPSPADDEGGAGDGLATAEVRVTVTAVNDAPVAAGAIAELALEEGGALEAIDLSPYFGDPDGDALTYSAVSSDPGVVTVTVAGAMLSLTPVGYGNASVEVTARDPAGLSASQTFAVGAGDRMAHAALDETLAALGRAHLASARMTLGRLAGPGGTSGSSLTVMGRRIPLGRAAVRDAAMQMLEGWTAAASAGGEVTSPGGRHGTAYGTRAPAGLETGPEGPSAGSSGLVRALRLGGLQSHYGGTEWMFAFGEEQAPGAAGGRPWRFWGQGDVQVFSGDLSEYQDYDGNLRTGWAGIDRALGKQWLIGVAASHSRGLGDWRAGSVGGRLETTLTALHPYLRWSDGRASVWAMAGGGQGTATNDRMSGSSGSSDLKMWLGLLEGRRRVVGWFGLRTDAAWARLATDAGEETVDGRGADVDQQRIGIELAPSARLGALALDLSGVASARRDGGDGQTGSGLELSGGFRASGGFVRLDLQGRILVLHSAKNYEERGLGAMISLGSPSAEEGFSLSVSPRWGGPATASGVLWNEALAGPSGYGPGAREMWTVGSAARYAHRMPGGSLVFLSGGVSSSDRRLAIVVRGGIVPGAARR